MDACCFDPLTGWKRDGYCNTDDLIMEVMLYAVK